MPRLFVVDTNVLVSGVVGRNEASPPVLLLNAMVTGRLPFVVSADLLAEYRRVLTRPRIAARHGRPPSKVDALLAQLTMMAYLRQPPDDDDALDTDDPPPDSPPGDEHIIRLLAHEPRAALVSGDQVLLDAVRGWREVLTSAELVALLGLTPPAV
jgi:predicted nucleic acid-binding protein